METQNVTLNLPKTLLRQARHVAVERGLSLSRLLAEYMQRAVRDEERYEAARRRALKRMEVGFGAGAASVARWTRDEAHER